MYFDMDFSRFGIIFLTVFVYIFIRIKDILYA